MNLLSLFDHLPTASVIAVLFGLTLSGWSALVAKEHWDGAAIGAVTLGLAGADGVVSQWVHAVTSHDATFDLKAAVGTALGAYLMALAGRFGVLKSTGFDRFLLAIGSKGPDPDLSADKAFGDFDNPDPLEDSGSEVDPSLADNPITVAHLAQHAAVEPDEPHAAPAPPGPPPGG